MSRAIDDLLHEHEAILFALGILDAMDQRLMAHQPLDRADITAFLGFLREFADKCHHGKEEGFLFPALVEAGIPERGGPVGVMLDEHAQGREYIRQMEAGLQPALDKPAFHRAAHGYSELLRAHIEKENQMLFPLAEKVLSAGQLDGLYGSFEAHENQVIGVGRHEELHGLLRSLRGKYLPHD